MKNILENKIVKYCFICFIGLFVLIIIVGVIAGGEDDFNEHSQEIESTETNNVSQEQDEKEFKEEDDALDYVYDFEVKDLHKALLKPEFHHLGFVEKHTPKLSRYNIG